MQLVIDPQGRIHALYDERLDLESLGTPTIQRGSHVEPDEQSRWWADLSPVDGPILGPFRQRSQALQGERDWLEANWLMRSHCKTT